MQDTIENLEGEIWKDIPGYEGHYMVSNMGRMKSLDRYINYTKNRTFPIKGILLKVFTYNKGYLGVNLTKDKKANKIMVHRLVASAFLGLDLYSFTDRKTSLCVCHKNDIRDDNRVENLFLGTMKDNVQDMINKGRCIRPSGISHHGYGKFGAENHHAKSVIQITKDGCVIKEWSSIIDANKTLGISSSSISGCCRNKLKYAGGYKWEYFKVTKTPNK